MINQRELAVFALIDVIDNKKYNNIVLKDVLKKNNILDKSQKGFITECVNGTLRNITYIDYIIDFYSNTKTTKMKPFILNLLRVSVYQLKFMDKVPEQAVVNEAVNLAKNKKFNNLAGFINAVLRNIIRDSKKITIPKDDYVNYLSIRYSTPRWILEYWKAELDMTQIEKTLEYQSKSPDVSICVNTLKINKPDLIKLLIEEDIEVIDNALTSNSLKLKHTSDITKKKSFIQGYYHVMDESSMICVDVLNPLQNSVVIDMCSAPGGKAFYSAQKMNNTGKIYAFDIHEHKIDLIDQTKNRLGITNINSMVFDGEKLDESKLNSADFVLIDAPCSGFGMFQKKPDIKYTKTKKDIKDLVIIQKNLLKNGSKYVKPGGTLVYSTCTISKEENTDNVKWFLDNFDFELEEQKSILPYEYQTDGFFIAKFKKV